MSVSYITRIKNCTSFEKVVEQVYKSYSKEPKIKQSPNGLVLGGFKDLGFEMYVYHDLSPIFIEEDDLYGYPYVCSTSFNKNMNEQELVKARKEFYRIHRRLLDVLECDFILTFENDYFIFKYSPELGLQLNKAYNGWEMSESLDQFTDIEYEWKKMGPID